jgi:ferredoxin
MQKKCNSCGICVKVCPVEALSFRETEGKKVLETDAGQCRACTICVTRCPQNARSLVDRTEPLLLNLEMDGDFAPEDVKAICNKAHMYPEQVVCYCYRTTAGTIAKAILSGARRRRTFRV